MIFVFRCKVRKPNGEIIDGCGHARTLEADVSAITDANAPKCSVCRVGFMRQVAEPTHFERMVGRTHRAGQQIHGGPMAVEAHRSTQAGSPEDTDARLQVLKEARARCAALAMCTSWVRLCDQEIETRGIIALLQSLLPASPAADKQAQVDMAAEHGARASVEEVAARLTGEYLGGCWSVPSTTLNAFFRQAYAHGKAERWAGAGVALDRIAGLVGAVPSATPTEIADAVADALSEAE